MPIKVKKGGVYTDPVAIFAKKAGAYSAVSSVTAKVAGAYVSVSGASLPAQTFRMGAYSNDIAESDAWLGAPFDFTLGFIRSATWAAMRTDAAAAAAATYTKPVFWAVGLTPGLTATPVTPLSSVAAGSNNADFTYIAQQLLLTQATGDILVRPGWEMNGNFYPWKMGGGIQADFAGAFVQFVNCFRAVSDRFKFSYCANLTQIDTGNGHFDPVLSYPGDAYVDRIDGDVYYEVGSGSNASDLFGFFREADRGLNWLRDFAGTHGKPWGVPEFGINSDTYSSIITLIADYFVANSASLAGYWESNDNFAGKLSNNQYPNAATLFKARYGLPTINSAATVNVESGAPLAFALVGNRPGTWQIIGGADAAQFSLSGASVPSGTATLNMAAKNSGTPVDAGGNNVYDVQLRFVDTRQKVATQNFAATVVAAYTFTNAEASAFVARMTVAPDYNRKQLIDTFVGSLKLGAISGINIYTKTKELYLFAAHTSQASLLGLKNQGNASGVNSPTFTTDRGWTGSGSAYVTTAIAANTATPWTQNSASMGVWELTNVANNSGSMAGGGAAGIEARNGSNTANFSVNTFSGLTVAGVTDGRGLTIGNRSGAALAQGYKNGLLVGNNTGSSAAPNSTPFFFHATNTSFPAPRQISFGYIGGSLTANEQKDLYNAVRAYHIGVGAINAGDFAVAA